MNDAASLHNDHFGDAATAVVNSPGRINLIGEHTDYCGLPVLPMAIAESIQFAASERAQPGLIAVSTLDGAVIDSDSARAAPGWAKYVLAVLDQIQPLAPGRGAQLALDGDLPSTGGLSSSSALSVGCVIALNEVWDVGLDAEELVAAAVRAEQSAAIAGGAMDQTVIAFARPGHALRIDFDPSAHTHIPMPESFVWIAGYSGTKAPKGESAANSYNSFVLASRAAAALLGDAPDPSGETAPQLSRVRTADQESISALPTISVAQAAAISQTDNLGLPLDRQLDLRISAEHVLSEADRVDAAEQAIRGADLEEMGRLMDASHLSLTRYGASTPSLDRLVAAARNAGAAGARLTGAGFGGWAIALTTEERAMAVQAAMESACGGPILVATAEGGALWSLDAR
ncbi:MAG: hypothetical protein GY720_01180 [bacterium]|nr:hypothetical protein [bacterium]